MLEQELKRREALVQLLALPDSPDIRRGHHLTVEGRPNRHDLIPELAAVFIQRHMVEQLERTL